MLENIGILTDAKGGLRKISNRRKARADGGYLKNVEIKDLTPTTPIPGKNEMRRLLVPPTSPRDHD
jgi:hypothetical protein